MPTLQPTFVEPDLTTRLGLIVIRWSEIEEWLSHLLATLMNADLGGMTIITSTAGAATQIQWILTVLSVFEHKDPTLAEVVDLVKRADELRIDRNALAHGTWNPAGCEKGTCLVNTYNWKHSEIMKEWLITTSDLDELLSDIDHWLADYVTLGRKFGFPRKQGEIKSIFSD
jgi:hypothetical protein